MTNVPEIKNAMVAMASNPWLNTKAPAPLTLVSLSELRSMVMEAKELPVPTGEPAVVGQPSASLEMIAA
jgi:hypothetical protein